MVEAASDTFVRARELFSRGAWLECLALLGDAETHGLLPPPAIELMAQTAYLVGHDDECIAIGERAYARSEAAGEYRLAARAASWTGFTLHGKGEHARGGAWSARARRLVDEHDLGGAEEGHVLATEAHVLLEQGQLDEATAAAGRSVALGVAAGDSDVVVLARLTLAWAAMRTGRRAEAMGVFDEIMLAVSAGETSPAVAGMAYCGVISACMQLRDLTRAAEWTDTLTMWCGARPDLVPYRGTCLVHRAQLMTLRGRWTSALEEATHACAQLPDRDAGEAWYQLGELHRLSGRFDAAQEAYRRANAAGRRPDLGLARLRMAQGRADAAVPALRRGSAEARRPEVRAELLAALVDALVETGDLDAARAAAADLAGIAGELDAPLVSALAAQAAGTVDVSADPVAALGALRTAWQGWRDLDLPYHAARTRVLLARCLRHLGDEDSARMEFDAAREVFVQLGAAPDVAAVDAVAATAGTRSVLTDREVHVMRLVASGLTNRGIADELFLSEKTVARHLSNIYAKLDLSSRAAATAYAYDHGLL